MANLTQNDMTRREIIRRKKIEDADKVSILRQISDMQALMQILNGNDTAMASSVSSIAQALGLLTGRVASEEGATTTLAQQIAALDANKLNRISLPDWTVVILAPGVSLSLAAGNRAYTRTLNAALGVKKGDPIFVSPKDATPSGYIIGAAAAQGDNLNHVVIGNPAIALQTAGVSITLSVFTLRP